MHLRDHPGTAAAILLACIAAHYAALDHARTWWRAAALPAPVRHVLPAPGTSARRAFDWCRENAANIHDEYWASACAVVAAEQRQRRLACTAPPAGSSRPADPVCAADAPAPDDSPDCTLPDERAKPLNLARDEAEDNCLSEALASAGHSR
ncbi:hypothetical protein JJB11_05815 [Ramlibacter ginsenosidimutans]|uniref:Uncharacterized protein n=1 Tax=Ramlibacter ginsenosidimutans TaxID=502333 RepID=A0A934TQJ7_9BURK|nr:hypothetical protein [Ramlibacter ginsenosidimutans]MBK6005603.1 hypothetical protein [Ramlibacter ginsenosidimutans]